MKFDELRSIAHNVSDSLASGVGLPIGIYGTDIFGEARRSAEGFIAVDFLTGTSVGAQPSEKLAGAIAKYRDALVDLCAKHNTSIDEFRQLTTCYSMDGSGPRFAVTVEDRRGRKSMDDYAGWSGARVRVLDQLGRIRRKPGSAVR